MVADLAFLSSLYIKQFFPYPMQTVQCIYIYIYMYTILYSTYILYTVNSMHVSCPSVYSAKDGTGLKHVWHNSNLLPLLCCLLADFCQGFEHLFISLLRHWMRQNNSFFIRLKYCKQCKLSRQFLVLY